MSRKTKSLEPIQASWKVSEVIGRYPQLVDVLAGLNPTFRLLRNPVARRVQSRLVTVAQAAQIARLEPDDLVATLNHAIGFDGAGIRRLEGAVIGTENHEQPAWIEHAQIAAEVDARALQREGQEPFGAIMAGAREVRSGEALRLISSFEPVPLYQVLGQRGFEHFARQLAGDEWEVLFLNSGRKGENVVKPAPSPQHEDSAEWKTPDQTITIDVTELVPPEPLIRIMEALEQLPEGASLLVHHVRRPIHLYPQLDQSGYRHQTIEVAPGKVEILIEKPAAPR